MALNYNAPANGNKSSIDSTNSDQMRTFFWLRKSLIEARKEQHFTQLASVENMPKHFGKTMKLYHYLPLLDDKNINDQGIDANGATISNGNLYGSSRDVGTITSRIPFLTENGGRVNRVGFTRIDIEGSLEKMGFFFEFSQESLDFDSDDQLKEHLSREAINGAVQYSEAILQKDLLASAGTVVFSGAADADDEITGESTITGGVTIPASIVDYDDLSRLDQILTDNRTPKATKIITGSKFTDTKVIPAARVAYVSSALTPVLERMRDPFGEKAAIAVQHYADAGTVMENEICSIGAFRFIQVPEMLHWAGKGAVATAANPGYRTTPDSTGTERYDVYPILVVGSDSFSTIGFQTNGKSFKFNVMTKMPGKETMSHNEPYGELGLTSIKWYYGFLLKRPERIAVIKTVAPQ